MNYDNMGSYHGDEPEIEYEQQQHLERKQEADADEYDYYKEED